MFLDQEVTIPIRLQTSVPLDGIQDWMDDRLEK